MTLSINLAMEFRPLVPNGDPARLAAQVISGIGFLGIGRSFATARISFDQFFEKRYIQPVVTSQLSITTLETPDILEQMRRVIEKHGRIGTGISIHKDLHHKARQICNDV
jgi:hypothetical protein